MLNGVAMDASTAVPINNAFGIQNGVMPENLFAWFVSQGFIGYQACAIIAQHWLVDKACSLAPSDAIRKGYDITANSGIEIPVEALDKLKQIDIEHKMKKQLVEFAKFNRVFGIRIAIFHVESDDPDYYQKPFNIDGITVGSYKGFSQVDPYWVTPELDADAAANPASRHFYEPTFWRVNGVRYHRSHLVVIRTTDVADVLKPSYIYAGIPLPQRIFERVYAAERTANEAPMLALTKRTNVMKVDMAAVIADQIAFEEKLANWIYYRDNQGVKLIGDGEELQQIDTSLADLDAVIMTQYQIVAAIANTPATKLLGTSPKGFGAAGEYEEASYHEYLETIQTNEMQPLIERHHLLAIKSDEELSKIPDMSVVVSWKPLDSMTETELAAVQLSKAQAAQALQATGAIDGNDIRAKLIADKDSGFNGLSIDVEPDIDLLEDAPTMLNGEPVAQDAPAVPVANQIITNLTGKQFQGIERILRKVAKGTVSESQGLMLLQAAYGFTPEQAQSFMGIEPDAEDDDSVTAHQESSPELVPPLDEGKK